MANVCLVLKSTRLGHVGRVLSVQAGTVNVGTGWYCNCSTSCIVKNNSDLTTTECECCVGRRGGRVGVTLFPLYTPTFPELSQPGRSGSAPVSGQDGANKDSNCLIFSEIHEAQI